MFNVKRLFSVPGANRSKSRDKNKLSFMPSTFALMGRHYKDSIPTKTIINDDDNLMESAAFRNKEGLPYIIPVDWNHPFYTKTPPIHRAIAPVLCRRADAIGSQRIVTRDRVINKQILLQLQNGLEKDVFLVGWVNIKDGFSVRRIVWLFKPLVITVANVKKWVDHLQQSFTWQPETCPILRQWTPSVAVDLAHVSQLTLSQNSYWVPAVTRWLFEDNGYYYVVVKGALLVNIKYSHPTYKTKLIKYVEAPPRFIRFLTSDYIQQLGEPENEQQLKSGSGFLTFNPASMNISFRTTAVPPLDPRAGIFHEIKELFVTEHNQMNNYLR